jgi:long-subunit acyl-CoA synthetase (AMP-forming)
MIAAGVERGDRVAIWATNRLGWIVAALGAQSAGAALVPINTRFKGEEAAFILTAAKVRMLVTGVDSLGLDAVRMLRTSGSSCRICVGSRCSTNQQVSSGRCRASRWSPGMRSRAALRKFPLPPHRDAGTPSALRTRATSCSRQARRGVRRAWS